MSRLLITSLLAATPCLMAQTLSPWPGLTYHDFMGQGASALIDEAEVTVHTWNLPGIPGVASYLDAEGNILRPYNTGAPGVIGGGGAIERRRFDGTLLWDYTPSTGGVQHHDIAELPNGNVLVIVTDVFSDADMIAFGRDPASTTPLWNSEKIIEVQQIGPNSGQIVWEWRAIEHIVQDFDPTRPNFDTVSARPERIDVNFPPIPGTALWLHMNAIDYNAELDQIVVSCRNWSELWVIDHSTTTIEASGSTGGNQGKGGDLLYRWGNPAAYDTVGTQQLANQHDVQWIRPGLPGAGNLLCFNNLIGSLRGLGNASGITELVPPVTATGSYTRTPGQAFGPAAPVWEYLAPVPTDFYSAIVSSAQRLPNGNTLVHSGQGNRSFELGLNDQIVWEVDVPMCFKARRYDFSLWAQDEQISAATGGQLQFDLVAGSPQSGNLYFLGGSITGTSPGFQLGGVTVPLVYDAYTVASAGSVLLPGSIGVLDANGRGTAMFDLPPLIGAGFTGTTFHHAYIVLDASLTPTMASNARGILMNP